VARQRLCLRATTDYWVNAMDGQPFFRVNQAIDPGLIKVIEGEIVPRLEHDVPAQHSAESLAAQPLLHRFTLVFDREGYSPKFVKRMKARRIACLCYHKYPGEDWSAEEFIEQTVKLQSGERVQMKLAERGTYLSGVVWLREIRKLTDSGHQTALLSTDYVSDLKPTAAAMFARWSQENFFRYARERFALDQLADYRTEDIPDPVKAVNPARRELDRQIYSVTTKLKRVLAKFGAFNLEETSKPKEIDLVLARKAAAQAEIDLLQNELKTLKKRVLSAMLREIPALAWYLGRPVTTVRKAYQCQRLYLQPPRHWPKPPRRLPSGGAPAAAVLAFRRSCGRKRPNSPSGTASPRLPSP
jgi:hypothetical protein